MAQKINPVLFRKTFKGLAFHTNEGFTNSLKSFYFKKNNYELGEFFNEFFVFFKLSLSSISFIQTNNLITFISLKYVADDLKKNSYSGDLFKQTICKGLLTIIPFKILYLRLINGHKSFFSWSDKKKLFRVLKSIRFLSCDPFNLIKILFGSFFGSHFFCSLIVKEFQKLKKHNKILVLLAKIFSICVGSHSFLKGVKISVSGKFNNRLRAKTKTLQFGILSLQKILSVVDYSFVKSTTPIGTFGVKVWFHY